MLGDQQGTPTRETRPWAMEPGKDCPLPLSVQDRAGPSQSVVGAVFSGNNERLSACLASP